MNMAKFNKENQALLRESEGFEEIAGSLEVTDAVDYEVAVNFAKDCKRLYQKIIEQVEPMKKAAKLVHTEVCNFENGYVNPLKKSEIVFKSKAMAWSREEKAKADAIIKEQILKQKKADAELAKKMKKAKPGEVVHVPPPPPPPATAPSIPKIAGSHTRDNWKHEVVDVAKLPDIWKVANDKALAAHAKTNHDKVPIPGVKFANEPILVG